MPRPPLPLGGWGRISRSEVSTGVWRARARYRDLTGYTRQVEAWGKTAAGAQRRLEEALRARSGGAELGSSMRLAELGKMWLAKCEQSDLAPQSVETYRNVFHRIVEPRLGGVMVREATVSVLERFIYELAAEKPGMVKTARVVLSGMLSMAARHDAIAANPMREVSTPRSSRKEVRALSVDDVVTIRRAIHQWVSDPSQIGQKRSTDILDVFDMMLATGARVGEICALRWNDVDLTADRPTVTISGTIVRTAGAGLSRQDHTKSAAGYRTITLPRFAVDMLMRRQVDAIPNPWNLVFPSSKGTIREQSNLRRQWRAARAAAGYDWVTPHTFRKTVATLIDNESGVDAAAAQLGHARSSVTINHYVQRAVLAPDVSEMLEQLGSVSVKAVSNRGAEQEESAVEE